MDRYPSEEELKTIEEWPIKSAADCIALARYCQSIWEYEDAFTITGKRVIRVNFSTLGWSGNESIVGALEKNWFFGAIGWRESKRGGHYKYEFRPQEDKK